MSGDREDETGFASRWSRLKQEAKADPVEVEAEAEVTDPEPPVEDERPDEEVLEELGLPDPDTLEPGDNFSGFMAKAVPARLRNRALRRLWISDPMLANLDELLDYGEDFTDAATVVENLQTAYQVGKGYIDKMAKLSEGDAPDDESAEEPVDEAPGEPVETSEETGAGDVDPADLTGVSATDLAEDSATEEGRAGAAAGEKAFPRRRMRFRLAED